jgi:tetratricopeptide (TPR) repeat protein
MPSLRNAYVRHATYYETVLRSAEQLYEQGGESCKHGVELFDAESENIKLGQAWAEKHVEADFSAAKLCSSYPNVGIFLLELRQHPRERIGWRKTALIAARRLTDRTAEGKHLNSLGSAYADLCEMRLAINYFQKALEIHRHIRDRHGEGIVLGNLGGVYSRVGYLDEAIKCHEKALLTDVTQREIRVSV